MRQNQREVMKTQEAVEAEVQGLMRYLGYWHMDMRLLHLVRSPLLQLPGTCGLTYSASFEAKTHRAWIQGRGVFFMDPEAGVQTCLDKLEEMLVEDGWHLLPPTRTPMDALLNFLESYYPAAHLLLTRRLRHTTRENLLRSSVGPLLDGVTLVQGEDVYEIRRTGDNVLLHYGPPVPLEDRA